MNLLWPNILSIRSGKSGPLEGLDVLISIRLHIPLPHLGGQVVVLESLGSGRSFCDRELEGRCERPDESSMFVGVEGGK
jgi:hypothetical protein